MNEQVTRILSAIDRKILEIGRLIQYGEHRSGLEIIPSLKRNLMRIRGDITVDSFQTIATCLDNLNNICEESLNEGADIRYRDRYHANRVFSGRRGRPKLDITKDQMELFIKENYTAREMAQHFGCSVKLVYVKCYSFQLKLRDKYFNGTDQELFDQILSLHNQFPNSGSEMMLGYLRAKGLFVQRAKVRNMLAAIDPLGTACRWSSGIHRRTYKVPTPNSLWHIDAHLKLIRWKFAVHGCIDGYSRLILYVKCATSMTASSVIPLFAAAVVDYGLPSRVRSDFGYENVFVAFVMNVIRGLSRGSHITGRSVHNQRIERLWLDVYNQVIDYFYNEFHNLEQNGLLDIENVNHMFALQKVYLGAINEKLELFQDAWNSHKIRTAGRRTPKQMWLSGMLENMNSTHTAPNEIFSQQQDLYARVLDGFAGEDIDEHVIIPEESESNLTVQLLLNDEETNSVQTILNAHLNDKTKYVEIVGLLNRSLR